MEETMTKRSSLFPSLWCLDPVRQNVKEEKPIVILHSCNGLILCILHYNGCCIVLNPTTQKYKPIPDPSGFPLSNLYKYSGDFFLAFEPWKSHHYKVVVFHKELARNDCRVHVFCSRNGSFKYIHLEEVPAGYDSITRKVFCNGTIHWVKEDNLHVKFDVNEERIVENRLPIGPSILRDHKIPYLGECDGRLFLIQSHRFGSPGFQILEMDTESSCWTMKHRVDLRPLALEFPYMDPLPGSRMLDYSVLYVKSGDHKKDICLVLAIPEKVVLYEVKTKGKNHLKTKVLSEFPSSSRWEQNSANTHPISQCLVPI